jgi:hypothetical protein
MQISEYETFKTGLNLETVYDEGKPLISKQSSTANNDEHIISQLSRLPHTVNMLTLKEMFLSDAPFVSRLNRSFWKKWMDTKAYGYILSSLYFIVSGAISENGTVNIDAFYDMSYSPVCNNFLAKQLVALFILENVKVFERDRFFSRLPEILCYMVINALATTTPKHHRIYSSFKFREILLDFMLELICGMKPVHIQINREWLFVDSMDTSIFLVTRRPSLLQSTMSSKITQQDATNNLSDKEYKNVRSWYSIEHSPLITSFLGLRNQNLAPILDHNKPSFSDETSSGHQQHDGKTSMAILASNIVHNLKASTENHDHKPMHQPRTSSGYQETSANIFSQHSSPMTHRTNHSTSSHDVTTHHEHHRGSLIDRLRALGNETPSAKDIKIPAISIRRDPSTFSNSGFDEFENTLSPLLKTTLSRLPSSAHSRSGRVDSANFQSPSKSRLGSSSMDSPLGSAYNMSMSKPCSRLPSASTTILEEHEPIAKTTSKDSYDRSNVRRLSLDMNKIIGQSPKPRFPQSTTSLGSDGPASLKEEQVKASSANTYSDVDYIDVNIKSIRKKNPLAIKVELTHPPQRDLIQSATFRPHSPRRLTKSHDMDDISSLKFKEKVNMDEVREYLRHSIRQRNNLLKNAQYKADSLNYDMKQMKRNWKSYLVQLDQIQSEALPSEIVETVMQDYQRRSIKMSIKTTGTVSAEPSVSSSNHGIGVNSNRPSSRAISVRSS